ncbi:MAG: TIGR03087 family PEP-CTERM/XrtA system glycosyltransferase [Pseudomonadota bacterium]
MSSRQRLLLLCHRIPYPPDKGDKIRAFHLLQFLAERYDVCLGAFVDDPDDMVHRRHLKELCADTCFVPISPIWGKLRSLAGLVTAQPLSLSYYRHHGMRRWVGRQRARGVVAEIAYSSGMAPYLKGARAPAIQDFVDADSAKWAAYGKKGSPFHRFIYHREAKLLARAEARFVHRAQRTFLVSPEEAATLRAHAKVDSARVDWYRNGVDTEYWRADGDFHRLPARVDVVFVGAMDYPPNVEGVLWFVKNVWPVLRKKMPSLQFSIVGPKPVPAITSLDGRANITVTGKVPDVRPYLAAARLAVAPLRIARGVQNKVLEAMAMGTPVVASIGANTGMGAIPDEHLLVGDTPEEMVQAIHRILEGPDFALRLGAAASRFVRANYQWEDTLARFANNLDLLLERD